MSPSPNLAFNHRLRRVAAVVSTVGNPLFTGGLLAAVAAFRLLDSRLAFWVTAGLLGGVLGPLAGWTYWQVRRGRYTNFDVSEREQRYSFYPRLIGGLALATAAAFGTGAGVPLRAGLLAVTLLLTLCYLWNFRLKVSLHAALSFFLAGCVGQLAGPGWGCAALLLAALVAASRLVLQRHTPAELLAGSALGLATAAGLAPWLHAA